MTINFKLDIPGYTPITTFWEDFSIADRFGTSAVRDTYSRAFRDWKGNYKYLTELVMVLNHKIWEHYYAGDEALSRLYDSLWKKVDEYCMDHLKDDELQYYFETTD